MKHLQHYLAYLFLFLLTCLFASYYILAKETLARIDPLLFTGGSLLSLLPAATVLGLINRRQLNRQAWGAGCLLGLNLAGILLALPIVLQLTGSATETAFFPCLSGVCTLVVERFRNREIILRWWAWAAGGVTMGGMLVVLTATSSTALHWVGDLLAFSTGTLGQTAYLFLVEGLLVRSGRSARGPIVTAQLITMCVIGAVCLPFGIGNRPVHLILPHDIIICAAVGCVPILLQVFISPIAQRYVQSIAVSCISSLEPVLAAMLASWFLGEQVSPHVLLGEALVVTGIAMSLLCQFSLPRWKFPFLLRHEQAPSFVLDTV